jgi:hypothetical protein
MREDRLWSAVAWPAMMLTPPLEMAALRTKSSWPPGALYWWSSHHGHIMVTLWAHAEHTGSPQTQAVSLKTCHQGP